MLTKFKILNILKDKKKILTRHGVNKIGLFGSYSKNLNHKNSDIDILVDFDPRLETFDNLMLVYGILNKSFEDHTVEIVTINGLSKYLGSYILEETVYV